MFILHRKRSRSFECLDFKSSKKTCFVSMSVLKKIWTIAGNLFLEYHTRLKNIFLKLVTKKICEIVKVLCTYGK